MSISIAKSLQAGVAALALAGSSLILPAAIPSVAVAQTPAKPQITPELRAQFRAAVIEAGGEFMKELIEQFPTEYRAFETEILEGMLDGTMTPEKAQQRGFDFSRGLAPRMYEGVGMAPDKDILAFARLQLKTARDFSASKPLLCAQLLEGSMKPDSTADLAPDELAKINNTNLTMMRLSRLGRSAKISRRAPTLAEINQVKTTYTVRNGDQRWLNGIGSGKFNGLSDTARCASAITWMESILAQDPAIAAILLAQH